MNDKNYYIHDTSIIDDNVEIGDGTSIWCFSHVRSGARIGKDCHIAQNVYVDKDVRIGDGVKLENNVSVFECVTLEDFVFCGPSCVFTNDLTPRARYKKGTKGYKQTIVHHDATIGANATIVCGNEIGEYATIGAGAVVTKDVSAHALMLGVPAEQKGWVCECGQVLKRTSSNHYCCPDCQRKYIYKDKKFTEDTEETES